MSGLNAEDFKIIKISKNNGTFRIIYAPNSEMKRKLKKKVRNLSKMVDKYDVNNSVVGFRTNVNCASSAMRHIGYACTIKMDLSNFFDTVNIDHLGYLSKTEIKIVESCLIEGVPRQGLPTSPAISNLAFIPVDTNIRTIVDDIVADYEYTRYADDLILSFNIGDNTQTNLDRISKLLISEISSIILDKNFILNKRKTTVKMASSGNRIITGIAVNASRVMMSRKTRRKIRAANHQGNYNSSLGLNEWGSCKIPNTKLIRGLILGTDFILTTNSNEISKTISIDSRFIKNITIHEIYVYSRTFKAYAIILNNPNDMKIMSIGGVNVRGVTRILNNMFAPDNISRLLKSKKNEEV